MGLITHGKKEMLQRVRTRCRSFVVLLTGALILFATAETPAQDADISASAEAQLRAEVRELKSQLEDTRSDLARTEKKLDLVLLQLQQLRGDLAGGKPLAASVTTQTAKQPADEGQNTPYISAADNPQKKEGAAIPTEGLSENEKLLAAQIEEQHQTKVESASKYRVKLQGLILMNAWATRGTVDVPDLPNRALPQVQAGSIGATLRQTIVGVQVFGPEVFGAKTSGNVSADFFGGFPQQPFGITAGLIRLREAAAHFDWQNTSLTFGQQAPFLSPLSPTSFATIAQPALSWAGNLWVWTPQAVLEHRFHTSDEAYFAIDGGVMMPLTEDYQTPATVPGPGAQSQRPAVASYVSWNSSRGGSGQPLTFGVGVYNSSLHYNFGRDTQSWAVTGAWRIPLGHAWELSGEGYRGRAVGGLGGGIWQSVVYDGSPALAATNFRPLNSTGGWGQIKMRPVTKWEANVALGQDNVFSADLRWAPEVFDQYPSVYARNRIGFWNVIYRPKSNLLLSAEYRYIWTWGYEGAARTAAQVNVGAGVSF